MVKNIQNNYVVVVILIVTLTDILTKQNIDTTYLKHSEHSLQLLSLYKTRNNVNSR